MTKFSLHLPQDFDDHEWEVESKGWYQGAYLMIEKKMYKLIFYDPARLAQDIAYDIKNNCIFFEKNLVVISIVNKKNMEMAVKFLMDTKQINMLTPESDNQGSSDL